MWLGCESGDDREKDESFEKNHGTPVEGIDFGPRLSEDARSGTHTGVRVHIGLSDDIMVCANRQTRMVASRSAANLVDGWHALERMNSRPILRPASH